MRLAIRLMGLDILVVEIDTDAEAPSPASDPRDLSGGSLTSYPVGFIPRFERPDEIDCPER